jgi:hypothetical protein
MEGSLKCGNEFGFHKMLGILSKRLSNFKELHGVVSQTAEIFIAASLRTSNAI